MPRAWRSRLTLDCVTLKPCLRSARPISICRVIGLSARSWRMARRRLSWCSRLIGMVPLPWYVAIIASMRTTGHPAELLTLLAEILPSCQPFPLRPSPSLVRLFSTRATLLHLSMCIQRLCAVRIPYAMFNGDDNFDLRRIRGIDSRLGPVYDAPRSRDSWLVNDGKEVRDDLRRCAVPDA